MNFLIIDTENDTYNKGSPFDSRFNPVCIGWRFNDTTGVIYGANREGALRELESRLNDPDTLTVGFNLKYDLHVLRKWGVEVNPKRIWCCQVAEYLLARQSLPYPSLEGTANAYGIGGKLNEVEDYWSRGVQTSEIPQEVLDKYVRQDVELTYQVFLKQQQQIKPQQAALFRLAMLDLLTLEEMEWNGLKYDRSGIQLKSEQIEADILELQTQLNLHHTIPNFNWNSNDHLSALLFGGTIQQEVKVPCGHFKSGKRAGQVKYKKEIVEHHLPRRFKPKRKTDGGKFSVDEDSLSQLGDDPLLTGILKIKELQKLNSTYFAGLLAKADEWHFPPGWLHTNFNQCVTRTGRLSSSKPNLQNAPEDLDVFFISRF